MIATTIATTIRPRMNAPNWAPVMIVLPFWWRVCARSPPNRLELAERLGQRRLYREPPHARGPLEPVAVGAAVPDVARVLGPREGAAVTQHHHVLVHGERGSAPAMDQRHTVGQRERRLGPDRSAGGEAHVADDDVRSRLGHVGGV